jgi:NADH-quinone oxidoreductase subunit L
MAFSVLVAVAGIALAYRFYVTRPEIAERLAMRLSGAHRVLLNKYYVDELYDGLFVRTMDVTATGGDHLVEEPLLDGTPVGVGAAARAGAGTLSLTQSGYYRTYILVFVAGAVVALAVVLLVRVAG